MSTDVQKGRILWHKEMVEDAWVARMPPGRVETVYAPSVDIRWLTRPDNLVRRRTVPNAAHP